MAEGALDGGDFTNPAGVNIEDQEDNFEEYEAENNEFEDYGGSDEEEEEYEVLQYIPPSNLHQACEVGELDTVIKMLNEGEDANKMERDGKTPLHIAASIGNIDLIRVLLKHNAIPTIITNDGMFHTCLHIASINGSSEAIQLFIESVQTTDGQEEAVKFVNAKDSQGSTALHYAAEYGFMDCVDILASSGANLNEKDETGKTAVHVCSQQGKDYVLELLISLGASYDDNDDEGKTALHWACIGGNKYCVDLLLSNQANIDARDETGLTPLHLSALNGNFEIVEMLLGGSNRWKGVENINVEDESGRTPLHAAACSGDSGIVQLLLDRNAELKKVDEFGRGVITWAVHSFTTPDRDDIVLDCIQTLWKWLEINCKASNERIENTEAFKADQFGMNPLHYASYFQHYSAVSFFLANGVDPLQQDDNGRTAVHYATHSKKFLELFKENEVSLTIKDKRGATPILLAAYYGNIKSVRYLSENGCSLFDVDDQYRTLIHHVALNKQNLNPHELLEYLIDSNLQLDATDSQGKTAIHLAASAGNISFLEAVAGIYKGPELLYYLNLTDNNGRQAVHLAAIANQPELLAFLIISGAESVTGDKYHLTPLHYAVALDKNECALSCIAAKVDTNCVDNEGKPPLFYSSWLGLCDMVDSLLFYGADVHFVDKKKNSALHYAAFADNILIMRILLEGTASFTLKNKDGVTPLHIIASKGNQSTFQTIIENDIAGVDVNVMDNNNRTPLHYACAAGNSNSVRVLLENGAEIDLPDINGQTAISIAAQFGNSPCISVLLDHKAKLKIVDDNGRHPLHWAAWKGSIRSCELLISTNIDVTDSLRRTPLHLAVSKGDIKLVEFLLSSGSKVDFVDSEGATPLMLACYYQQLEIVKILIKAGADVHRLDEMERSSKRYAKTGAKQLPSSNPSTLSDILTLLS